MLSRMIIPSDWLSEEVDNLARVGLRTLVIAQREIGAEEYREFTRRLNMAKNQIKDRDAQVLAVVQSLEKNMVRCHTTTLTCYRNQ